MGSPDSVVGQFDFVGCLGQNEVSPQSGISVASLRYATGTPNRLIQTGPPPRILGQKKILEKRSN